MSSISVAVTVSERSYDAVLRTHRHDFHQVLFPAQGRMTLQVEEQPGWVGGGQLAFVAAGAEHVFHADAPNRILVADLDAGLMDGATTPSVDLRAFIPLDSRLSAIAAALRCELHSDGLGDPLVADALGRYLMAALRRAEATPATAAAISPGARRLAGAAEEFLRANYARPLSIAEVAAAVGSSPAHLHRSFRAVTGASLLTFVHRLRLEQAAELLLTSDLTVLEITNTVGFASQSHLTRLFTRHFGVAPGRYRAERSGSRILLPRSGKTEPRTCR